MSNSASLNSGSSAQDAIEVHYRNFMKGRARLEKLVPVIMEKLEEELKARGIQAKVAGRVKNKYSLRGKLAKHRLRSQWQLTFMPLT